MVVNIQHNGEKYVFTVPKNQQEYSWIDNKGDVISDESLSETLRELAVSKGVDFSLFSNFAAKNMQKHNTEKKQVRSAIKLFPKTKVANNGEIKLFNKEEA